MDTSKLIHEIRNPLNSISMNAELGKLSLQKNGDIDRALAAFNKILDECHSCSDQLTQLKAAIDQSPENDGSTS